MDSGNTRFEIKIDDLVKKFGDINAVDGLSLEIKKGELFGFLGPNGAGKTTTINILVGLLKATSGTAHIRGFDINKDMDEAKNHIGVCPQEAAVFEFLSGYENLELMGNLHSMDKKAIKERTELLIKQSDFSEAAKRKSKGYSGG